MAEDDVNVTIDRNLQEVFSMNSLLKFDENIRELFQKVFYSTSHELKKDIESEELPNGIIEHFLKSWKETVGASSLSKTLPTVLTGSIIEGSSLSRLFRSSEEEESVQLEADVMYISGCISHSVAKTCFQNLPSNPGFLNIKYSEEIELFTTNITSHDISTSIDINGNKYLDGSKLKAIHQELQPSQSKIDFKSTPPRVVLIDQHISGPSSEILFKTRKITDVADLKAVSEYLERVALKLQSVRDEIFTEIKTSIELRLILNSVLRALIDCEIKRITGNTTTKPDLMFDEVLAMKLEISDFVDKYREQMKSLQQRGSDLRELVRYTDSICGNNDVFFMDILSDKLGKPYEEIYEEAINGLKENKFYNDGLYGELCKMEQIISISYYQPYLDIDPKIQGKIKELANIALEYADSIKCFAEVTTPEMIDSKSNVISFDNVPCFYCPFWPSIAGEWTTRHRLWPSKDDVERIISNGCFVVSKPSDEGIEYQLEWRWSFSSAEISIAHLRSPFMNYCYFIFKSLFYQYLKGNEDVTLPSFIAKTCMLNFSEQHDQAWWENRRVSQCVISLFHCLYDCLISRFLSNHFMSSVNILTNIPDHNLQRASEIVSRILDAPGKYILIQEAPRKSIQAMFRQVPIFTSENRTKNLDEAKYEEKSNYTKTRYIMMANTFRWQCKYNYYSMMDRVEKMKKMIEIQKMTMFTSTRSNATFNLLDHYTTDINEPLLKELSIELKILRSKGLRCLREITDILKWYCIVCDSCSSLIPCGTNRYHCRNKQEKCSFDICIKCHSEKVYEHSHALQLTDACSPHCYSLFNEEVLGRKDWAQISLECSLQLVSLNKQIITMAMEIGSSNKEFCSIFKANCVSMEEDLTRLYQRLGIQAENDAHENVCTNHVSNNSNAVMNRLNEEAVNRKTVDKSVNRAPICEKTKMEKMNRDEQSQSGDSNVADREEMNKEREIEGVLRSKYSYEEDVEFIRTLLKDYERREIIFKLVYKAQ